ncbi:MAG: sugar phosphate isomerase/epimerase [Candidatus Omnitrophica bacterium]|nr:sugar phosphate isomerase/epimerase [Candidatus Omnitrophota bacterium]
MGKIPVALQLYSVREDCNKDFVGTLRKVSEIGYEGVEFAGYYGKRTKELKKILEEFGLKVAGTHIGIDTLLGDELQKTIEFNSILGNKFLIVPGLPEEYRNSKEAWSKTANLFNEISEKVKPYGMRIGYHNHWIEFKPTNGEIPWDIFFGAANNDVVMQLDTGNGMKGGGDPVEILRKYPGRAATIHLKEFSSTDDKAILGEGEVNWNEILNLCETTGKTEWYIVEQESYAYPPIDCVRLCLKNLRRILEK